MTNWQRVLFRCAGFAQTVGIFCKNGHFCYQKKSGLPRVGLCWERVLFEVQIRSMDAFGLDARRSASRKTRRQGCKTLRCAQSKTRQPKNRLRASAGAILEGAWKLESLHCLGLPWTDTPWPDRQVLQGSSFSPLKVSAAVSRSRTRWAWPACTSTSAARPRVL